MVVRQGKVRKRVALKKLLLVLKSRLKKFRFLIKRRKNKKMHCRSRLRSGSGDSIADDDGTEGNPWFFAQTLFPAVSG